jgi:hypothetical protein
MQNFYRGKKEVQLFVLFQQFSQKLPEENSRPIGVNSPNLVTLKASKGRFYKNQEPTTPRCNRLELFRGKIKYVYFQNALGYL